MIRALVHLPPPFLGDPKTPKRQTRRPNSRSADLQTKFAYYAQFAASPQFSPRAFGKPIQVPATVSHQQENFAIQTAGTQRGGDTSEPRNAASRSVGPWGVATMTTNPICVRNGVAICSVGELFGGVERHILGLACGLRARGVRSLLILFREGELASQARVEGFEPIILPGDNYAMLASARKLAQILVQHGIEIVHVHGYKATVFCALAQRLHPFAMVKTEHGLPELMSGRPLHALRNRFYHFVDRAATRRARASVCYVTAELRACLACAHEGLRLAVIPNGVATDAKDTRMKPADLRKEWFNLALVGRVDTVKGHDIAIHAISQPTMPEDVHLHIIGVGPLEVSLRAMAEQRGIGHRVHFLGFRRNVAEFLAHCDVLLMPSLHEGLPYALLEAMALGTPIIASHVGGLAEVLQDGETALLVPVEDSTALAKAIVRSHSDPTLRERLGRNARALQQANYSLDAMVEHYVDEYVAAAHAASRI